MTLICQPYAQNLEDVEVLVHVLDSSRVGVTGATVALSIRRDADGFFFNGLSYQSSFTTVTMTQVDSSNLPGVYRYQFMTPASDAMLIIQATTAAATAANDPYIGQMKVGYWAENIDTTIASRASQDDMDEVIKRLGATIAENEYRKIIGLLEVVRGMLSRRLV